MKPAEILLRPARPDEHAALTAIALAAKRYWGYPEAWIRLWEPDLTVTADFISRAEVVIAQVDDAAAGFMALTAQNGRGRIEHLWVLPGQMGRGLGTQLFREAVRIARLKGLSVIEIESDPNAQAFYTRMGARTTSERTYALLGQARVLPVLELDL